MTVVKPFAEQGNWTQMHNLLIDIVMPGVSDSTWKVLCFMVRHTKGMHKKHQGLSYDDIMAGTGIASRSTVSRALAELLNPALFGSAVIVKKDAAARGISRRTPTRYALNPAFRLAVERPVRSPKIEPSRSPNNGLPKKVRSPNNGLSRSPNNGLSRSPNNGLPPRDAYKDRTRGKESTNKEYSYASESTLIPVDEYGGGGVLSLVPPKSEENTPPPPPQPPRFFWQNPKPDDPAVPDETLALALCEICCVDPIRPRAPDRDRWPDALAAAVSQNATPDLLRAFRDWWFATPTAGGTKRSSLYLSNVAAHLRQFLQQQQIEVNYEREPALMGAPRLSQRERLFRERQSIQQEYLERFGDQVGSGGH